MAKKKKNKDKGNDQATSPVNMQPPTDVGGATDSGDATSGGVPDFSYPSETGDTSGVPAGEKTDNAVQQSTANVSQEVQAGEVGQPGAGGSVTSASTVSTQAGGSPAPAAPQGGTAVADSNVSTLPPSSSGDIPDVTAESQATSLPASSSGQAVTDQPVIQEQASMGQDTTGPKTDDSKSESTKTGGSSLADLAKKLSNWKDDFLGKDNEGSDQSSVGAQPVADTQSSETLQSAPAAQKASTAQIAPGDQKVQEVTKEQAVEPSASKEPESAVQEPAAQQSQDVVPDSEETKEVPDTPKEPAPQKVAKPQEPVVPSVQLQEGQMQPALVRGDASKSMEEKAPEVQVSTQSQTPTQPQPDVQVTSAPAIENRKRAAGGKFPFTIEELLQIIVDKDASDLHITVGYPPMIRIDGDLAPITDEIVTKQDAPDLINPVLPENKRELLEVNREVDLSYSFQDKGRFRVNAYYERGNPAAALRLIPNRIRSIEELKLPGNYHQFAKLPQGFVLVTGPTGHGKSTTLAAIIQEINMTYPKHIITIEDPIEYMYPPGKALLDQREMHEDTHSWEIALRSALRQDPDVVLVGEMRDYDTIASAITLAETGHLVFATLHTNNAAQTIDRVIDVFPEHQQAQVRAQLSNIIEAVISQRLIPIIGGGRRAVSEVLLCNAAVRNLIREGKSHQIDNVIRTSMDVGMKSLEHSLVDLVREGAITVDDAEKYAVHPEEVVRLLK